MDTTLVKLIDLKKELNSEIENYKIQIFSGRRSDAEKTISEYKILYNDSAAIIRYEAPNYKIWIGSYYTLVEAEKEILEVRKKYPNAFIFKPTKLIKFENEKLSRNGGN
ncbi:MAG: SPOR domain-containing protein [Flavobacteriaceae bacterium]